MSLPENDSKWSAQAAVDQLLTIFTSAAEFAPPRADVENFLAKLRLDAMREILEVEKRGRVNVDHWLKLEHIRLGFLDKSALDIEHRLRAAGRDWFALKECPSGQWFLNPYQQDKYNYGRFTLEDLEAWIEDKGPIVKSAARLEEERKERAKYDRWGSLNSTSAKKNTKSEKGTK
jgi:hypothetical protein